MEWHRHRLTELGIEPVRYFNSGVLLLNLASMRQAEFSRTLIERVACESKPLMWPDQDGLNLTAQSRWIPLHPRWNYMNSLVSHPHLAQEVFGATTLAEAGGHPAIRHFEGPGPCKPWHFLHDRDGQRLYREHRAATPWPHYTLEGRTTRNRVKRLIADVRRSGAPGTLAGVHRG